MANSQTALLTGCRGSLHEVHLEARLVNLLNIQIPSWAKGASSAAGMINARSETAQTLPAFRDP
jgi:putative SOS response-associated peptidase YedK